MPRGPRIPNPLTRVSAWLADIDDWDATDADVFVASLDKAPPPREQEQPRRTA